LIDLSGILPPDGNIQNYLHTFKGGQDPSVEGDTVIDAEAWADYEPPDSYLKNTTRYLQFQQSHVISSPNMPTGETSYMSRQMTTQTIPMATPGARCHTRRMRCGLTLLISIQAFRRMALIMPVPLQQNTT
jgi:hypothetical protein